MKVFLILCALLLAVELNVVGKPDIVVASDGSGDYTTLTEAIDNLPYYNYQRLEIWVKNGIYNEKIRLERDYLTIRGESRDSTIIEYAQLREDWQRNPDFIGPAVINIHADDIILDNLTIKNTQPLIGPHAFTILGTGTRTIITNCTVSSKGGDTVSLWNYKQGMYYHANCYFEGCVDFVCPRGWCYIKNSEFHQLKNTATLWHAGVDDPNKKFVLNNCSFSGVANYQLGRHHYEAAFYLINCTFAKGLADQPIYFMDYPENPKKARPYFWKDRYYFSGCKGDGFMYSWFEDNFIEKNIEVMPEKVTPLWTFNNKWNPENEELPQVVNIDLNGNNKIILEMSESVGTDSNLTLTTSTGKILKFINGQGRKLLLFESDTTLIQSDFIDVLTVKNGEIFGNIATVNARQINKGAHIRIITSNKGYK